MSRLSYASASGIAGPVSVEKYLMDLLMHRAASKLQDPDVDRLLSDAAFALSKAGKWTDDVMFQACMKKPVMGKRHGRLLHGVPSPRFWPKPAAHYPALVAKDIIYFFADSQFKRARLLQDAMPVLHGEDDLTAWLKSFSSTRFEKQLVKALISYMDDPLFRRPNCPGTTYICSQVALVAAEIDRLAWFTGQKSMTLANAAPVWRPNAGSRLPRQTE
ncbi:MAG: hypothetical protein ACRERX_14690 [Pseudomonas sp.]